MQIREDSFKSERPECPRKCNQKVYRHGWYWRFASFAGNRRQIQRFRCSVCNLTLSILPTNFLPYRILKVASLQKANDERAGIGTGLDPRPTLLETGAIERAWTRFSSRKELLQEAFGQFVSSAIGCALDLWKQIRQAKGSLENIQVYLSTTHHRSLLGDYRCLKLPQDS